MAEKRVLSVDDLRKAMDAIEILGQFVSDTASTSHSPPSASSHSHPSAPSQNKSKNGTCLCGCDVGLVGMEFLGIHPRKEKSHSKLVRQAMFVADSSSDREFWPSF